MKKNLLLLFLLLPFYQSFGQIANHVVISELFVGGNSSTTADWIELYNPTSQNVDLSNWKIKYKSSTGSSVSATFTIQSGKTIAAYGYFLISSNGSMSTSITPDVNSGSVISMSASAGHIALVRDGSPTTNHPLWGGIVVDLVGYGAAANAPEGSPAPTPSSTGFLQRKARGGARTGVGNGYDSDNNANDFVVSTTSGVQNSASPVVAPSSASFTNGFPTVSDLAVNSVKINTQMAEDGKTYYVVLPDQAAAPSVQQIKEGKNADGDAVALAATITHALGNQAYSASVSGLTPETAYDIYLVAEYGDGVTQLNAVKLDATTTSVLPVELLSFEANWVGNRVQLLWKTASETTNQYYELDRSVDGVAFHSLASVKGKGTTASVSNYSVYDERPLSGTSYYRLKQFDANGFPTTIAQTVVKSALFSAAVVKVYPNPTVADIFVELQNYEANEVEIKLTNMLGQEVHQQKIMLVNGVANYRITPKTKLPKGYYVVSVKGNGLLETVKLVVD